MVDKILKKTGSFEKIFYEIAKSESCKLIKNQRIIRVKKFKNLY